MAKTGQYHRLGMDEMDAQHLYLYKLFSMIENSSTVSDSIFMKSLMKELERFLNFHLYCEEYLMRLY